jgi:hypothetical protein
LFEEGRFYIPERLVRTDYQGHSYDLVQSFIQEEYLQFPYMTHDDMLDCIARIRDDDMQTFFPKPVFGDRKPIEPEADDGYDYNTFSYLKEERYA